LCNRGQTAVDIFETIPFMNPGQIEPTRVVESLPINERLWQAWLWKGRELDRLGARNRLRFLQALLGIGAVVAVFQNL
jgi:hypothetical protein